MTIEEARMILWKAGWMVEIPCQNANADERPVKSMMAYAIFEEAKLIPIEEITNV